MVSQGKIKLKASEVKTVFWPETKKTTKMRLYVASSFKDSSPTRVQRGLAPSWLVAFTRKAVVEK
jgi:hypothetical protein